MVVDAQATNKSVLDFKQRIKAQQKLDNVLSNRLERKKDEQELNLLRVKQKEDLLKNQKQYYEDLSKQKKDRMQTERKDLQMTSTGLGSYKSLTDFSKTPTVSAMIPGINNWSTIGSKPLNRGLNSDGKNFNSVGNIFALNKISPPKLPNHRLSKYQNLKELEKEYFEFGPKGTYIIRIIR